MKKKIYNKLVRDRIPEIIKKDNCYPKVRILKEAEFVFYLKKKFVEESEELARAKTKDEVLNELSDISELAGELMKLYKISQKQLKENKSAKLKKRGGFKKRLFLEYVE